MAPNIRRKSNKDLLEQVWGNWGKNPSHPQKFACCNNHALNQSKNTNIFTEILEILLTPNISRPPKSGALGSSLFSLMVNPRQSKRYNLQKHFIKALWNSL